MDQKGSDEQTKLQQILTLFTDLNVLKYESFYSKDKIGHIIDDIVVNENVIAGAPIDGLIGLCLLRPNQSLPSDKDLNSLEFNAVKVVEYKKLSRHGRFKILRNCDVLQSISISCYDPKDILSVTLYMVILLPKDIDTIDLNLKEKCLENVDAFDRTKHIEHYIPIKTINNPTSNCISFFECPILMLTEQFRSLSVEVQFHERFLGTRDSYNVQSLVENISIKLETLVLAQELRGKIAQDPVCRFHTKNIYLNQ